MAQMNRRHFLEESMLAAAAAASASLAGAPWLMAEDRRESSSPNERLRGAVIGVNGRGGDHISELEGRKGLEIAYICDIDTKVGNRRCVELARSSPSRRIFKTSASSWMKSRSTLSRSPRPTIGIRWPRSGRCRPARMCMSKSRSATT